MTISRESPLPLYSQIRQDIEQSIREGQLSTGEKLPSEDQLAERFGVSRLTVRRAIDQLVSQGLLRRAQGRGTFVAERRTTSPGLSVSRWSFEQSRQGEGVSRRILQVEEVTPGLRVAHLLRTMPGEPIVQINTVLYLQGEPLGCCTDRFPKLLVPTIDRWDLAGEALPEFLAQKCGFEFGKVEERVRAVPVEEDVAEILGVEPGSPGVHVDSLVCLASGIPVFLSDTMYRGDRYMYRGLMHALPKDSE